MQHTSIALVLLISGVPILQCQSDNWIADTSPSRTASSTLAPATARHTKLAAAPRRMSTPESSLILTGVILTFALGPPYYEKAMEFYALHDIPDLSNYSVGVASNGKKDEIDWDFPNDAVAAGTFIYVARAPNEMFRKIYGVNATYDDMGWINFNGNDNVLLWFNNAVVDRFGIERHDPVKTPPTKWIYRTMPTLKYRRSGSVPTVDFNIDDWFGASKKYLGTFSTVLGANCSYIRGTYVLPGETRPGVLIDQLGAINWYRHPENLGCNLSFFKAGEQSIGNVVGDSINLNSSRGHFADGNITWEDGSNLTSCHDDPNFLDDDVGSCWHLGLHNCTLAQRQGCPYTCGLCDIPGVQPLQYKLKCVDALQPCQWWMDYAAMFEPVPDICSDSYIVGRFREAESIYNLDASRFGQSPTNLISALQERCPRLCNRCHECPTGSASESMDSDVCVKCKPGRYTSAAGRHSCDICPTGTFTNAFGSTECTPCEQGQFSSNEGSSACQRCPLGTYQQEASKSVCLSCAEYLPGSTTAYLAAIAPADCICAADLYRPMDDTNLRCQNCPKGMRCAMGSDMRDYASFLSSGPGGVRRLSQFQVSAGVYPLLIEGFWSDTSDPLSVFQCQNSDYCPGGNPGTCVENAKARACAHCENGYYASGSTCDKCNDVELSNFMFPILPFIISIVVILGLYYKFQDLPHQWGSWQNGVAAMGFIVLNFFQIISMVRSTNVRLPSNIESTFGIWAGANDVISLFRLSCTGYVGFQVLMILQSLVPIMLAIMCMFTFANAFGLSKITSKIPRMDLDRLVNIYLSLIHAFFLGIVSISCALFKCQENPNGKWTLMTDVSVLCYESGDWKSMLGIAISAIMLYCVGTMCLFSWVVFVAPRRFQEVHFQKRWKFLFIKFRTDVYWWGLIILWKGVLLNAGLVSLQITAGQLYWLITSIMLYVVCVAFKMPWRHHVCNFLDILVHLCAVMVISMMAWFAEDTASIKNGIAGTVIVASCLPIGFWLLLLVELYRFDTNMRLPKIDEHISEIVIMCDEVCDILRGLDTMEKKHLFSILTAFDLSMLKFTFTALRAELAGQDRARLVSAPASKRSESYSLYHTSSGAGSGSKQNSAVLDPLGDVEKIVLDVYASSKDLCKVDEEIYASSEEVDVGIPQEEKQQCATQAIQTCDITELEPAPEKVLLLI